MVYGHLSELVEKTWRGWGEWSVRECTRCVRDMYGARKRYVRCRYKSCRLFAPQRPAFFLKPTPTILHNSYNVMLRE